MSITCAMNDDKIDILNYVDFEAFNREIAQRKEMRELEADIEEARAQIKRGEYYTVEEHEKLWEEKFKQWIKK